MAGLTYAGVFDDEVAKYPWEGVRPTSGYLERQLFHNLIYDRKLLINDGYLVAHDYLRAELLSREDNFLSILFRAGYLAIYHRSASADNIARGLEDVARSGNIQTHLKVINSDEWPLLAERINGLAADHAVPKVGWSTEKNSGEAFNRLIESILDLSSAAIGFKYADKDLFEAVFHDYYLIIDNDRNYNRARGKWEQACIEKTRKKLPRDQHLLKRRELMQIANECYHMSHGMCLAGSKASPEMAVLTGLSGIFTQYITASQSTYSLANLVKASQLLIVLPDHFNIPKPETIAGIAELQEFRALRSDYLSNMNALLLASPQDTDAHELAINSTNHFVRYLVGVLGSRPLTPPILRIYGDGIFMLLNTGANLVVTCARYMGVDVGEYVMPTFAGRELLRHGRTLQGGIQINHCIRDIGLMQPKLDHSSVRTLMDQVSAFSQ